MAIGGICQSARGVHLGAGQASPGWPWIGAEHSVGWPRRPMHPTAFGDYANPTAMDMPCGHH